MDKTQKSPAKHEAAARDIQPVQDTRAAEVTWKQVKTVLLDFQLAYGGAISQQFSQTMLNAPPMEILTDGSWVKLTTKDRESIYVPVARVKSLVLS
jgi:hypothetical protein